MKRLLLWSLLLIPLLGFTQCQPSADQPEASTSPVATTKAVGGKESAEKLFAGFGADQDYRVTIVSVGAGAQEMGTIRVEFDAPDKTRTIIDAPQGQTEMIVTPEAGYMNLGGTWLQTPGADVESMVEVNFTREDLEQMTNTPGVEYLGEEVCGDTTCQVYGGIFEGAETKVYFDPVPGRPYRVETTQEGITSTINYEYTPITIEVPETTGLQIPTPGANGQMEPAALEALMDQFKDL